ncbi:hypothetical protein ONS96_014927 [Cadophora gregata f. sp. sojae]|nr:hypothetical protein ONS96_014927 [Cadophora gregata f. sp. sojae]
MKGNTNLEPADNKTKSQQKKVCAKQNKAAGKAQSGRFEANSQANAPCCFPNIAVGAKRQSDKATKRKGSERMRFNCRWVLYVWACGMYCLVRLDSSWTNWEGASKSQNYQTKSSGGVDRGGNELEAIDNSNRRNFNIGELG